MKKTNKLLLVLLLVLVLALSAFALVACKVNESVDGTYYYGVNGNIMENNYYILNDKTWMDNGGSSGEYELNGTSITLYVDTFGMKTEYMSGTLSNGVLALEATRGNIQYYYKDGKITDSKPNIDLEPENKLTITYDANGGAFGDVKTTTQTVDANTLLVAPDSPTRQNYTFSGWSKSKSSANLWDFANDKATDNTTLYAAWKEESARIFSVDGATIANYEIYLLVDKDTDIVSLSNKVVCSDDSTWKLYYDRLGQVEIPTKIAASASGSLVSGSNVFYVVVTSNDGTQTNLYTLDVYRSYSVNVAYYANNKVIHTDTAYTGYEYTVDYTPTIEGYTFNHWKSESGSKITTVTPTSSVKIIADVTANEYKCTLDVNKGNALDKTEYSFTYDQQFTLPRPTRTGYTFQGWFVGSTQFTNANGQSVNVWNSSRNVTATAKWQANKYEVTVTSNDTSLGTVTGGGEYDYDSRVTITTTPKTGCNFLGWYDKNDKLVSEKTSYTFTMRFDVSYIAKYNAYTLTTSVNDTKAGTINKTYTNEKVAVGTSVTLTATVNNGYNFLGWYDNTTDTLISSELSCILVMPRKNISIIAKYNYYTITTTRNDISAGTVTNYSNTKVSIGQSVTVTAMTDDGYTWVGWYDGESLISTDFEYTFDMPAKDIHYTAKWINCPITIETNIVDGGVITGMQKTILGQETTITAKANAGYVWIGWFDHETLLTSDSSFIVCVSTEKITLTAKYQILDEMLNFIFTATSTTCKITGIKDKTVSEIIVPDYVTEISEGAFRGCNYLQSIKLPFVGKYAQIPYGDIVVPLGYIFGSISYDGATATEQQCYHNYGGLAYCKTYYIPTTLTSVICKTANIYAFYNCSNLINVTILENRISREAFGGCKNLTSIICPNVTSIGPRAFANCSSLTRIIIPAGVRSIGGYAFYNCTSLAEIKFDGTVAQWNAITKDAGWNSNVPATKVICSDGEVAL